MQAVGHHLWRRLRLNPTPPNPLLRPPPPNSEYVKKFLGRTITCWGGKSFWGHFWYKCKARVEAACP